MRQLPEPEAEGQRRLLQIGVQAANRLDLGLLHDVRRVHARTQLRVEAQLDELTQVGPVLSQELLESLPVPRADLLEQALGFRGIR